MFRVIAMDEEKIVFSAKYGDWISIRKMFVDPETKAPEIASHLIGVQQSISRKIYPLLGIDEDKIQVIAANLVRGKKRGYAGVSEIFSAINSNSTKSELASVCSAESMPFAEALLTKKVIEALGLSVDISPDEFSKVFPEFKIAKPRGNFGGKKKKSK